MLYRPFKIGPVMGTCRFCTFFILLILSAASLSMVRSGDTDLASHGSEKNDLFLHDIPTNSQTFAVDQPTMIEIRPDQVQYTFSPIEDPLEILAQTDAIQWQTLNTRSMSFGNQHPQVWVRFQLFNPQPTRQSWFLELRWNNLQRVDFYQNFMSDRDQVRSNSDEIAHFRAGVSVPAEQWFRDNTTLLFPVILDSQSHGEILLKISSRHILFAPLYLWPEASFYQYQLSNLLIYALILGMIAAILLYNLWLLLFIRDRSYLFYCCYLVFSLLYLLAVTGIGHHMIWGQFSWFSRNAYDLGINGCFLFSALFFRYFLLLPRIGGWVLQANSFFLIVWILSLYLQLIGIPFSGQLLELAALLTLSASLVITVALIRRGISGASYFLLAWITLIMSTFFSILTLKGYIPFTPITQYASMAGFALETILLAIALAERINHEREQGEQAQQRAYQLQLEINEKRESAIQSQRQLLEHEKNAKRELEIRVSERTLELQQLTASLEMANRELSSLSITDSLTGISNRRFFDQHLHKELQRTRRHQSTLVLVLIDIDHFKHINDTWGHPVGDICLRWIARRLGTLCQRSSDCIARYGGEEFALILPDSDLESVRTRIDQIRIEIADEPVTTGDLQIPVTFSAGIASVNAGASTSADVLACEADAALYTAKNSGRNQIVVFAHT
jgi:two-component system, sensor histidine kinase LadS